MALLFLLSSDELLGMDRADSHLQSSLLNWAVYSQSEE